MKSLLTLLVLSAALLGALPHADARAGNFTLRAPADTVRGYVGDTSLTYIIVGNSTGSPLTVTTGVSGSDAANFWLYSSSLVIPVDSGTAVSVAFRADSLRNYSAWIVVSDGVTTDSVQVNGKGIVYTYTPLVVTAGVISAMIGQTHTTTTYVYNQNPGPVTLDSIRIVGPNSASLTANTTHTLPYAIARYDHENVNISYTPTAHESYTDSIVAYYQLNGVARRSASWLQVSGYAVSTCANIEGDTTFTDSLYASWSDMRTMRARNMLSSAETLVSVTVDDSVHWRIDSAAIGRAFSPMATTAFVVTFSPAGDSSVSVRRTWLHVTLQDSAGTCTTSAALTGYIKRHAPLSFDTTHLPLGADTTETLELSHSHVDQYVRLDNNSGSSLIIDAAYLAQGIHFSLQKLYPDSDYAFHVPNGTYAAYRITLLDTDHVYYDTLYVVTEQGLQAIGYPIEGNKTLASVIDAASLGVKLTLSPNPTKGNVNLRLDGFVASRVEVLDVLGNVQQNITVGQADRRRIDVTGLQQLAAGSYFIRVTGVTDSGVPVIVTRKLALDR